MKRKKPVMPSKQKKNQSGEYLRYQVKRMPSMLFTENKELVSLITTKRSEVIFCDDNLLELSCTQWQYGDWDSLISLSLDVIQDHPHRSKLAMLVGIAHAQKNQIDLSRRIFGIAKDWGCSDLFISQILVAGAYNSLGRAEAAANLRERAVEHFEKAIAIVLGSGAEFLSQVNITKQLNQMGLPAFDFTEDIDEFYKISNCTQKSNVDHIDFFSDKLSKDKSFLSLNYWEERYRNGGTSGAGSYGVLADFKAMVVNKFISDQSIQGLIEFGSGDGNQLSKILVKNYVGVDVSEAAVQHCRKMFKMDVSKKFFTNTDFLIKPLKADLTISLDVIYHLVEDENFEDYMHMLFEASEKYCIIYSCNDDTFEVNAPHVRRRKFSEWVEKNIQNWHLFGILYNDYPYSKLKNGKTSSMSDFYFYKRS